MNEPIYQPSDKTIQKSNLCKVMKSLNYTEFKDFYNWSNSNRESFWNETLKMLHIKFHKKPKEILNLSDGIEHAHWLYKAKMNIVESCFSGKPNQAAIIYQTSPDKELKTCSYEDLYKISCKVANGLKNLGINEEDRIAIYLPMTKEAIAIYLGSIIAGVQVVTIADSFSPEETKTRLEITNPKYVFTIDSFTRSKKKIQLYDKVKKAGNYQCVIIRSSDQNLSKNDLDWNNFLSSEEKCPYNYSDPEETTTILFSSGTTGSPKAIPWNHTTPIKAASDGFYHHDIHEKDVICWPTNLGWMMGPWLVFASLINKATIGLYYDSPLDREFGKFVQTAKVNMLGVVPSLVRAWKTSQCMESLNWDNIKCFSSTGECSNSEDMAYLMGLANNKPVIEYCGGTEIGGGYLTGTIIQPGIPGTFSTPALGGSFEILDQNNAPTQNGEIFITPPSIGLSTKLLNRDHHAVYYKETPILKGTPLRKHGDQVETLENGYYKAHGRVDDSINLGGIKVSSIQIEETVNTLEFIQESAAIGVPPKEGGPDELILCLVLNKSKSTENALELTRKIVKSKINPLFKVEECHIYQTLPRTASNKVMRRKLREELITKINNT